MSTRTFTYALCALSIGALSAVSAEGALVGVQLENPLLVTYDLQVDYAANGADPTGTLTITGEYDLFSWRSIQQYSPDGVVGNEQDYLGSFLLTAQIDKAAKSAVSGSLAVWSDTDLDTVLDTLRASSSDLVGFGYASEGLFDFWFTNGTGDLATAVGKVGVIVDGYIAGLGEPDFLSDFSNNGNGKADIPEPATLALLGLGAVGVAVRRRR